MITTMIMTTRMVMAAPMPPGSTARQTLARMIMAMATITAMPAIPMITPPT